MSWIPVIVTHLSASCFLTNLLNIPNPLCTATDSANTAQIVKALVMTPAPVMANVANMGASQPLGVQTGQNALSKALSIIASQPTPGLAAMSEAELDSYLAGLGAPEPTTMLTVATSMPTMQSSP